jgi:hypothetical protein
MMDLTDVETEIVNCVKERISLQQKLTPLQLVIFREHLIALTARRDKLELQPTLTARQHDTLDFLNHELQKYRRFL